MQNSRLKPISCLLWDVDDTMVDTTALIADSLDYIYRKYFDRALPYNERRALIGIPLKKQIRIFGELESFGIDEASISEDFIAYYEAHRDRERILDDVVAVLVEGKRLGFPTALVTSKNDEELANTLPRLGIDGLVDTVISADAVSRPKPHPEGLLLALQRLGIASDQAVYTGDTVHDMRAARSAGVRGVAVTWGACPQPLLAAEQPAALVDTAEALRQLLLG